MYGWKRNVIKIEWAREALQNLIGDAKHGNFGAETLVMLGQRSWLSK